MKLDILSYHHPDPRSETIVVLSDEGIFIAHSPVRKNPVAAFDLRHMSPETTTSMFFKYGAESNVPRSVILPGDDNEYRFAGDAIFELGDNVRVAQSTIGVVPYITVVAGSPGTEAVLGILGDQVVVNMSGTAAVEQFEATADAKAAALGGGIFHVSKDSLSIGGRTIAPGTRIGLRTEPDFFCLQQGVSVLPAKTLLEIQKKPKEMRLKELERAEAGGDTLDAFLLLKASDSSGIAMEFSDGAFMRIEEHSIEDRKVCASRKIDISNQR
ncbi:MAG: hypothetical protein KDD66_15460 [Bdellovibrionales bacterium]|nr:hypothetical protein [Bdellovibrionales bacterium]